MDISRDWQNNEKPVPIRVWLFSVSDGRGKISVDSGDFRVFTDYKRLCDYCMDLVLDREKTEMSNTFWWKIYEMDLNSETSKCELVTKKIWAEIGWGKYATKKNPDIGSGMARWRHD